jgi:hypothetical protein
VVKAGKQEEGLVHGVVVMADESDVKVVVATGRGVDD